MVVFVLKEKPVCESENADGLIKNRMFAPPQCKQITLCKIV